MQLELRDSEDIKHVACLIALYTASRVERRRLPMLVEQFDDTLYLKARDFFTEQTTAVPTHSLYSMAKEARNVASLTDTLKLVVDHNGSVARSATTDGMATFEKGPNGQRLIMFDPKLVNRTGAGGQPLPNQFPAPIPHRASRAARVRHASHARSVAPGARR